MASMINTNIASLNAQRNLTTSQSSLTTSLQRLSSGLRINSAKDDAAGLAISERMSSQIKGSDQAIRNANDGISLAQTAEGDLSQIGVNLQRMRELAVQSSNATNSASDRAALNNEVQQLASEIDRVAQNSSFNGVKLLDGSFNAQDFQVGANSTANDRVRIDSISSARTSSLGGVGTSYAATTTGTATTGALAAGDLTLNGFQVGASTLGSGPGQSAASAFSIAAAINKISSSTGVTATANANTVAGGAATAFGAIAADTFSINGINVGAVASGTNAPGQGANLAAAINAVGNQTGVTASANATTGAVTLTAADGRDISIGLNGTAATAGAATTDRNNFLAATGFATGNVGTKAESGTPAAAVVADNRGTISLSSTSANGIVWAGDDATKAGLAASNAVSATVTSSVASIATVNISTAAGASNALAAIDGALATVNGSRASLGAYQNRFASVVSSLQTTSENLTASRSRIQDTDFASETANLTRGQILQQAGTAMLAQANSLPQGVLALLRG
jgi:flagellin